MAFTLTLSFRRGREKEKTGNEGAVMRDSLFWGEQTFLALKVPRQCPLVLLVEKAKLWEINLTLMLMLEEPA
jgi:hypothetical protein